MQVLFEKKILILLLSIFLVSCGKDSAVKNEEGINNIAIENDNYLGDSINRLEEVELYLIEDNIAFFQIVDANIELIISDQSLSRVRREVRLREYALLCDGFLEEFDKSAKVTPSDALLIQAMKCRIVEDYLLANY